MMLNRLLFLALVLPLTLLVLFSSTWLYVRLNPPLADQAAVIKPGMTEDEVGAILGEPQERERVEGCPVQYWKDYSGMIEVWFDGNAPVGKTKAMFVKFRKSQ